VNITWISYGVGFSDLEEFNICNSTLVVAIKMITCMVPSGMIEQLLSLGSIGHTLRDKVIFKIIPMMNPDGVFLGNYRYGSLL